MALDKYFSKRDFAKTKEPKESKKTETSQPIFVIQKHAASRLHFDFRIEAEGVLKSWAVPKGLPRPGEKHLAVMVEDHPYDYKDFEGTIPRGNYGAGTVMVWDRGSYGTYTTNKANKKNAIEKQIMKGLKKGHINVLLEGKKVRGEFALVKMKGRGENNWLMFAKKGSAEFLDEIDEDVSAKTGRTMQEIEEDVNSLIYLSPTDLSKIRGVKKLAMPGFFPPMLAEIADEPFDDEGWIFEIKWDGFRTLAFIDSEKVELKSRNNKSFNQRFSEIYQSMEKIKGAEMILDGEIVSLDENGRANFQYLQYYQENPRGILMYMVFDLLYLNGYDLRDVSLLERKNILWQIFPNLHNIKYVDHIDAEGIKFFNAVRKKGIEGIIAKQKNSPYLSGKRSEFWKKNKAEKTLDVVIGGWTEPRGTRKNLGALILGIYKNDRFIYVGHTGGGLTEQGLKDMRKKLEKIETNKCPFSKVPKTNAKAHWTRPVLAAEVKFTEWTEDGLLRHPIFLRLKEDVDPKKILRKQNSHFEKSNIVVISKKKFEVEVEGKKLTLSNLGKIFWPEEKYAKGDLIKYYEKIADYILPHLKDRPQSLNRFPDGIKGQHFFQKDMDHLPPNWARTKKIYSESKGGQSNYIICNDKATLLYLANLSCIELNVWNSRVQSLDKPDYLVLDLDPENIEFSEVVKVAKATHKILEKIGAPSFVKTSGSRGLHIYIPLGAKYTHGQAQQMANLIAVAINRSIPENTSLERSPKKRQKKVYIDYLQNGEGKTMAAPYCLRPKIGAPVSTPLDWKELNPGLNPAKFNIKTIFKRLKNKGDLWKELINNPGIEMKTVLAKLQRILG